MVLIAQPLTAWQQKLLRVSEKKKKIYTTVTHNLTPIRDGGEELAVATHALL